ncbi:MAG: 5-formyltetrahydrofolate cyclo-ligase [Clostridia bacterium]|nr:5-formyltetrahydrofolate cyclo-ligase [Clostridia bacterium]
MAFSQNNDQKGKRYSLKIRKSELRAEYLAKKRDIPPERRAELDAVICRKIMSTASFRFANTVLAYSALPTEVDIRQLIEAALSQGKRVALPRCIPDTPLMNFHLVQDLSALCKGSFSIMEPSPELPVWTPQADDRAICIIPGVLFDTAGYRIGYGRGFYDRYLSDKSVQRIGVIYDGFILESLPHGKYDLKADFIVSDKRLLTVKK